MDNVKEILSQAGVFQGVNQETVQALLGELETVHFPRRATIFNEGEPGDRFYIIINDKMKLARCSADGRGSLLTIIDSSDMFGELFIFDPGPCTSSAVYVTEVSAASMGANQLQEWAGSHPDVPVQLLRMLARRLRRTNNSLADLISTNAPGRVAKSLLQLANCFGVQEGSVLRVDRDLTQEKIAQLVGAPRETVNKVLAEFAHRGWIRLESRSALIFDTKRLARRAR